MSINNIDPRVSAKMLGFQREMTAATATVAYTGLGFKPSALIWLSSKSASIGPYCIGFAGNDKTIRAIEMEQTSLEGNEQAQFYGREDTATNYQKATVASYDDDGFTLDWGKFGTPGAGTLYCNVLALR